jgi:hypothetical protein
MYICTKLRQVSVWHISVFQMRLHTIQFLKYFVSIWAQYYHFVKWANILTVITKIMLCDTHNIGCQYLYSQFLLKIAKIAKCNCYSTHYLCGLWTGKMATTKIIIELVQGHSHALKWLKINFYNVPFPVVICNETGLKLDEMIIRLIRSEQRGSTRFIIFP